jgi:NAD(P)-dependent dehydrogenase (short-subunit alcohol dehydrogenase family)
MARTVLITGCRSGFGLLTAKAAAEAGWIVYAGLRDRSTADELLRVTAGLDVRPLQLDITSARDRDAAVRQITEDEGGLDGLVNNAGRALGGFLELVEEDELRSLFEVNVFGTWAMTRAFLPLLRERPKSTVVMVSSTSGITALPGLGAYASSKFALEGMGEAWRHELALLGIRVVLIEPGAYATDIFSRNQRISRGVDAAGIYTPWSGGIMNLFEKAVDRIARDPIEVSDAIMRILEHRRPPLRFPIGPSSSLRVVLRRFIPSRVSEGIMQRLLEHARRVGAAQIETEP